MIYDSNICLQINPKKNLRKSDRGSAFLSGYPLQWWARSVLVEDKNHFSLLQTASQQPKSDLQETQPTFFHLAQLYFCVDVISF